MAAGRKNIEFKVGIIILLGLVILVGSLYWLQGYRLARNSQLIKVQFSDVGTLSVGDKVTVSGVNMGKVESFKLDSSGVIVDLRISRKVHLDNNAKFTIKNMGVMGERFIAISPGNSGVPLDTLAVAKGSYDEGIPEIMGLLGQTITELQAMIKSFRENVQAESTLYKFNRILTNLDEVTHSTAAYLQGNQTKLNAMTENFLNASQQLSNLLTRNAPAIDTSVQRIDRITANVETLVVRLDTVASTARRLADAIETHEGTIQLLLEDRRLYDDLRQTADNLDDLINDIKANPRKYINLKVQLF